MLIVSSENMVFNLDRISKLEINFDGTLRGYGIQADNVNIEIFNKFPDNVTNYNNAKEIMQDILDAYAKGIRVFYISGRIVWNQKLKF